MRNGTAAAIVALVGALAGAGCGDEPAQPRSRQVQELVLPSDAEREAAEKRHEAEVFLAAGKSALAEAPLRRVLELTPRDGRASELLAQCLVERGKVAEAVPLLRTAVEATPRRMALRLLLVRALMTLGDHAGAEAASDAWTKADASSAEAWFELGRARYQLGRFDAAIEAFRRAETLKASRADIRSELGLALAAAGDLKRAEAKQRDALDRQPEYADAWFRLGDVIFRRDPARAKEAAEALEKAVEHEPSLVLGHLYLFRVCRLAKVADDDPLRARGEKAWAAVLRIHGRVQLASVLGADAFRDDSQSEFALEEKVSLAPDDPAPRLALAKFLHAERRWDEAIAAYRRALESGAPAGPTRVRLAVALVSHGEPAAAETELRAVLADTPAGSTADASVHRLLAWTSLVQGKDDDAAVGAAAALALAPDDVLAKKIQALAKMHRRGADGADAGDVDAGLNEIAALGWL